MGNKQAFLDQLAAWYGWSEAAHQDDIIIDIYNSQRPKGSYKMSHSDAWCQATMSAAAYKSGNSGIIPNTCACVTGVAWFRNKGRFKARGYKPSVGDICYYDWNGDGVSNHVGAVRYVTGSTIIVREGNHRDKVLDRTIAYNNRTILGFGVPNWGSTSSGIVVPNTTNTSTTRSVILRLGSKGTNVKNMQTMLIAIGYSCGSDGADGDFGSKTKSALIAFQKDYGLLVDGEYGPSSDGKLQSVYHNTEKNLSITSNRSVLLKLGSKGDAVKSMQNMLLALHYNLGTYGADGDFGKDTENAVKQFQELHKLTIDGQCGPITMQELTETFAKKTKAA